MTEIDEAYDDRLCYDCGGWCDVARGEPGSCTCPDDPMIAALRPGERPRAETTLHLPGDDDAHRS